MNFHEKSLYCTLFFPNSWEWASYLVTMSSIADANIMAAKTKNLLKWEYFTRSAKSLKKTGIRLGNYHRQTTKTALQRRTKQRKISFYDSMKKNTQNHSTKSCHHLTKNNPQMLIKSAIQSKSSLNIFSVESFPQALLLIEKNVVLNHGKAAYWICLSRRAIIPSWNQLPVRFKG